MSISQASATPSSLSTSSHITLDGDFNSRGCKVNGKQYTIFANTNVYKSKRIACCTRYECDLTIMDATNQRLPFGRVIGYTIDKTVPAGRSQRAPPVWATKILNRPGDYTGDDKLHAGQDDEMTDTQKVFQLLFEDVTHKAKEELGEDNAHLLNGDRIHHIEHFRLGPEWRGQGLAKPAMLTYLDTLDTMGENGHQGVIVLAPAPIASETERKEAAGREVRSWLDSKNQIVASYKKSGFEMLFDENAGIQNAISIMIRTTTQVNDDTESEISEYDQIVSKSSSVSLDETPRPAQEDDLALYPLNLSKNEDRAYKQAFDAISRSDREDSATGETNSALDGSDELGERTPTLTNNEESPRSEAGHLEEGTRSRRRQDTTTVDSSELSTLESDDERLVTYEAERRSQVNKTRALKSGRRRKLPWLTEEDDSSLLSSIASSCSAVERARQTRTNTSSDLIEDIDSDGDTVIVVVHRKNSAAQPKRTDLTDLLAGNEELENQEDSDDDATVMPDSEEELSDDDDDSIDDDSDEDYEPDVLPRDSHVRIKSKRERAKLEEYINDPDPTTGIFNKSLTVTYLWNNERWLLSDETLPEWVDWTKLKDGNEWVDWNRAMQIRAHLRQIHGQV